MRCLIVSTSVLVIVRVSLLSSDYKSKNSKHIHSNTTTQRNAQAFVIVIAFVAVVVVSNRCFLHL